ncbi:MAG TPA: haloalkane dehalogenase [Thermoanaerobaculia bacterium]|nr:haloalkane dehalogenase [Thermoanaerobaculia bacterium]
MSADPSPFSTAEQRKKRIPVLDTEMAYVDRGKGAATAVFLHGNPTSSYLWRNVIAEVEDIARCLAPDLVGMGDSGPNPAGSYRFVDHARYLDSWLDAVLPEDKVFLVIHDWGSALGFHWARRHPERVAGIAYMEAIVSPIASWDDWPEAARSIFQALRSPAGEEMILRKNVFVERILPGSVLRGLSAEEMAVYRRPFREPGESRRPTLAWPREIPIAGEPADVVEIVGAYAEWLATTDDLPKLFVDAEPGAILIGAQRETCRTWPNQREVTVRGSHFVQEDSPKAIGAAVRELVTGGWR